MAYNSDNYQDNLSESSRFLVGLIADYETTIGFLLAGIAEYLDSNRKNRNFLMVTEDTTTDKIESYFHILCEAKRVGVILISTEIYKSLYEIIKQRTKAVPIIIEIPSRKSLEYVKEKHEYN